MYVVKVHLLANTNDNPTIQYFNDDEVRNIFTNYIVDNKLSITKDAVNGNERELWFSYIDKETRDQLKSEIESFNNPSKNDVTVTILEEGYDLE